MQNRDTYFGFNPSVNIRRSKLDMSYRVKTAFNNGQLVPLGEPLYVLPGDTFTIGQRSFIRMNPTINVPMDDIICDVWWFYVPFRIIWTHWKEFCGENNADPWTPLTTYTIPKIFLNGSTSGGYSITLNSILSHMGIPQVTNLAPDGSQTAPSISALPVRAYCSIWNSFFMDENYQYPIPFSTGDSNVSYTSTAANHFFDAQYGNSLLPLNRFHDYFSSCLPAPQFGDAIRIPLGDQTLWNTVAGSSIAGPIALNLASGTGQSPTTGSASIASGQLKLSAESMGTIDALNLAIKAQRYLWQLGNYGHRYVEILKGLFGTTAPDYLLDRPLLLGTTRFMINLSPVVQTSASETTTFDGGSLDQAKGSISGYSATRHDVNSMFTHSFVEHGLLVPVYGTRTHRSYAQGISKHWKKSTFLDFYNPIFDAIGSQPVFTYQIYAGKANEQIPLTRVWGYQEAWAEYRYNNDLICGLLHDPTLYQYWTYSDVYGSYPTLDETWLQEGLSNINRNLYLKGSSVVPQFLADFYIQVSAVRPMSTHSVPNIGRTL